MWALIVMTDFRSLNNYIALLLLLIFSAAQLAQCIHSHHEETCSVSLGKNSKVIKPVKDIYNTSNTEINKAEIKCKVCDYIQNHQSRYLSNHQGLASLIFQTKLPVLPASFTESLFDRCVHTWTNKGPPIA